MIDWIKRRSKVKEDYPRDETFVNGANYIIFYSNNISYNGLKLFDKLTVNCLFVQDFRDINTYLKFEEPRTTISDHELVFPVIL